MLIAGRYGPSFASKKSLKKKPVIGLLTSALQSIFISRGASEEQRQQIIKQICHRQNVIEQGARFPPLCIFPEGGTSNSKYLLQFKKGAFIGEKTVRPIVLKYNFTNFSPCYDIVPFLPLIIMTMAYGW
jgi:lysophosphatidylcholine acyltransferase/lyso-PAF acetyltransferase